MRVIVTNTLFVIASAALTLGTVLAAVPAQADTAAVSTHNVVVPYGDLNLAKSADRNTLKHRIEMAAISACIMDEDSHEQACQAKAIDDAMRQVGTVIASAETTKLAALR